MASGYEKLEATARDVAEYRGTETGEKSELRQEFEDVTGLSKLRWLGKCPCANLGTTTPLAGWFRLTLFNLMARWGV